MTVRLLAGLLAVVIACVAPRAGAHPHSWIDIEVDVLFDAEGRVRALRQGWIFDETYTVYLTSPGGGARRTPPTEGRLAEVAAEMMGNLREHDYFTRVERGGVRLKLATVESHGAAIRDARLVVTFVLPLVEPADAKAASVVYSVFDPSYFIEMVHANDRPAIRLVDAPAGCATRLRQPNPPSELKARAAGLDRTQSGGNSLGVEFAEKVSIRCGAAP